MKILPSSRMETYSYTDRQVAKIITLSLLTGGIVGATLAAFVLTYVSVAH